jgi:hypothetical protein
MSEPMQLETIEQAWKGFEAATINENAGAGQRRDMENAFYAGALIMFANLTESSGGDEEAAMKRFGELEAELEEFAKNLHFTDNNK